NINLLKILHDNFASNYLNATLLNGFVQLIFKATRIQGKQFGLIDHILTNTTYPSMTSGVIISDISDHFFTFTTDCNKLKPDSTEYFYTRIFSKTKTDSFKTSLSDIDWRPVLSDTGVDSCFDSFWNIFKEKFELHFPLKKVKRNKNIHKINQFMTKGLLISRKTKLSLLKNSIANPSQYNIDTYKNYRNLYNKLLRISRAKYYESSLNENRKNPKKTWELIGEAINKSNVHSKIPELVKDGVNLIDDKDKANAFNDFFTGIGSKISNTINDSNTDPQDFLTNRHDTPLLDLGTIGPIHVNDVIKSLPNKSSQDLEGISLKLLKSVSTIVSVPLSHIFNLSLDQGIFPSALKCSRTVPVFKNGNKNLCDNYRPISLVPTISKILEKIIAIKLSNHLDINKLLYKHQYGFQRGKQTEQNLIHLLNFVSNSLNNNKICMGIFLDIKKAFDCVPHDLLFKKLHGLGIRDKALDWFKSYLTDRRQMCDVNGSLSDVKHIDIGVLQGSTLGPILFLCFINDLPNSCPNALSLLFADDTACLISDDNPASLFRRANSELKGLANWFRTNKLAVNVSKTKYIVFHTKQKKLNLTDLHLQYDDNDNNISLPDQSKITVL
ncbi:MAG: hypothetical protein FJ333_10175, partial [Sphingomonadales bacterium]|nr:hypothetical protein [Sphingomonadales bacterium]